LLLALSILASMSACGRPLSVNTTDSSAPVSSNPVAVIAPTTATPSEAPKDDSTIDRSPEYRDGYAQGRLEAHHELAEERATIYAYGLRRTLDAVDRTTGLNVRVIAGCVVDDTIHGRADGHDGVINAFIKDHGTPWYSRKKWEYELFHLSAYLRSRSERDLVRLYIGGAEVSLQGGHVRLNARPDGLRVYVDGAPLTNRFADGQIRRTLDPVVSEVPQRTDVAPGPDGADLVIFRWQLRGDRRRFGALDLRTGDWLHYEYE
jgi:hypothetical protein